MLGWQGLTGGLPRPYTHSLATPLVLVAAGQLAGGRTRPIAFGAAFGVAAHLVRDLCTGTGSGAALAAVRHGGKAFLSGVRLDPGGDGRDGRRRLPSPPRAVEPPRGAAPAASALLAPFGLLALAVGAALAIAPARADGAPTALGVYLPRCRPESLADRLVRSGGRAGARGRQLVQAVAPSSVRWLGASRRLERGARCRSSPGSPGPSPGEDFRLEDIADGAYDGYVRRGGDRRGGLGASRSSCASRTR